jgi:hypothetical protein
MGKTYWREPAQICENGHIVNSSSRTLSELNKNFCPDCGARTLTECPACGEQIDGTKHMTVLAASRYRVDYSKSGGHRIYTPKPFCGECGAPYPWTERAQRAFVEAAQLYLEPNDAAVVEANLPDVMRDTSRTELALRKIQQAFQKGGQAAVGIFNNAAPTILAEGAKALFDRLAK